PSPKPVTIGKINNQTPNRKLGHFAHRNVERRPLDLRRLGAPFICPYYGLVVTISVHLSSV
ncbi:MAG: hypothetical protein ACKOGL_05035, partial [Acidimicrobiaceae bacterium]